MPNRSVLRAAFPMAAALLAMGCQPAAHPPQSPPPPAVTVVTAEPREVAVAYEYVGQTAGYREVEVRARVTGILLRRNYKEGAAVKQGETMFTIDPAPFQVAVARAEADLGVAQARLEQARRDVARLKPVLEAKAVSQKELDDATSAARIAEAEVKSVQARLNEAKLNLQYTRVEAPISGVASRAAVSEGTLVSGPNVLLTTVTQTDPMYVIFGIPDREYLAIRRDVEAGRLKLPPGNRFKTTVKLADGTTYTDTGDRSISPTCASIRRPERAKRAPSSRTAQARCAPASSCASCSRAPCGPRDRGAAARGARRAEGASSSTSSTPRAKSSRARCRSANGPGDGWIIEFGRQARRARHPRRRHEDRARARRCRSYPHCRITRARGLQRSAREGARQGSEESAGRQSA